MTGSSFCGTILTICFFLSGDDYKLQDQKDNNIFYQASIHLSYNDEFLCGAAVVSSHEVLTLGSCLYYNWGGIIPPIIVSVKVGGSDLNTTNFRTTGVSNITFHDHYDSSTLQYDLAVIHASKTLQSSQFAIGTISLATDISSSYNSCTVTGWNKETKILQAVDAEVTDCDTVYDKKLCALPISTNSSLCESSLGSLLVCDEALLGILSVEPDCNYPNQKLIFEMAKYAAGMINVDDIIPSDTSAIVRQTINLKLFFGILIFLICLFI